jgi:hypothetical protein
MGVQGVRRRGTGVEVYYVCFEGEREMSQFDFFSQLFKCGAKRKTYKWSSVGDDGYYCEI